MNLNEASIDQLLWREVASKSKQAAIAFCAFAIFVFVYRFKLEAFEGEIRLCALAVIIANLARYQVSRWIGREALLLPRHKQALKLCIWANALAWSVIYGLTTYELQGQGPHFIVLVTIMTGFVAASLVTLGYAKSLFLPFQVLSIFPFLGVLFYQYLQGLSEVAPYLMVNFGFFFLYQLRQFRSYRSELVDRFTAQQALESSLTELRRSQQALIERTAELVHASKISALGEMAGGLAHEVNNSTQVILGAVQQLGRSFEREDLDREVLRQKMQQVRDAIFKIKDVIEGLKLFSQQLEPAPRELVPLEKLIQRSMNYSFEMLKQHSVDVTVDDIPAVEVLCHPFQLNQVLFNLTKNADDALQAVPDSEKWIRFRFRREENTIAIEVSNGGPGIPEAVRAKLFQPFFTTKAIGAGRGLSLSVAKGIARDHGGDLVFEADTHTKFVLTLPIHTTET
jgi:signal transduction histidine kinase